MRPANRRRDEVGFTIVELLVVVLILGILIAVGIPSFTAARTRAQDGAAKSILTQALTTELTIYADDEAFTNDDAALEAAEPELVWGSLVAPDGGVTATTPDTDTVILRTTSGSGTTFCLGRIATAPDAGTYRTLGCGGSESRSTVAGWDPTSDGWSS